MTKKTKIRIGVGVSTMNRPKTLNLWLKQYQRYCNDPDATFYLHIARDYPLKRKGVAGVKNECLRALKHCDYIYLFDDDCFPIHPDWWKPFIEAHLRTRQHHFLWLMDDSARNLPGMGRKLIKVVDGVSIFHNAQGCCMFMTKAIVDAVGGFAEFEGAYGFEHENYSYRCREVMGEKMETPFISVPGIEDYIYSLDVQGVKPYINQLGNEVDKDTGRLKSAIKPGQMVKSLEKNKEQFYNKPTNVKIEL